MLKFKKIFEKRSKKQSDYECKLDNIQISECNLENANDKTVQDYILYKKLPIYINQGYSAKNNKCIANQDDKDAKNKIEFGFEKKSKEGDCVISEPQRVSSMINRMGLRLVNLFRRKKIELKDFSANSHDSLQIQNKEYSIYCGLYEIRQNLKDISTGSIEEIARMYTILKIGEKKYNLFHDENGEQNVFKLTKLSKKPFQENNIFSFMYELEVDNKNFLVSFHFPYSENKITQVKKEIIPVCMGEMPHFFETELEDSFESFVKIERRKFYDKNEQSFKTLRNMGKFKHEAIENSQMTDEIIANTVNNLSELRLTENAVDLINRKLQVAENTINLATALKKNKPTINKENKIQSNNIRQEQGQRSSSNIHGYLNPNKGASNKKKKPKKTKKRKRKVLENYKNIMN
jgi:hypothetical protein